MGKGKPSEIWKEIKPRIGDMVTAANDMEQSFDKAVREAYEKGYTDAAYNCHERCAFLDDEKEEAYRRGLNDAWEAARKIWQSDSYLRIFKVSMRMDCFTKFSATEVIEKIRQYEQENEEIQVGDEVVGTYTGGEETEPFVIIRKIPEIDPTYYFGIYSKSGEFCQGGLKLKKTGRHFPEIAAVLKKMREGQEQ